MIYETVKSWSYNTTLERIKQVAESCKTSKQRDVALNYCNRLVDIFCNVQVASLKTRIELHDFAYYSCSIKPMEVTAMCY